MPFILLVLFSVFVFAEPPPHLNVPPPEHTIQTGLIFQSRGVTRGANYYNYPILFPVLSFSFWQRMVDLSPRGLRITRPLTEKLKIGSGIGFFNDNILLEIFGDQESYQKQRDTSVELYGFAAYDLFPLLGFELAAFQELISHGGQYIELKTILKFLRIMDESRPIVFGSFATTLGFGSAPHNRYLYGSPAEGGLNHLLFSANFVFPNLFWGVTPIAALNWTSLLGESCKAGNYVSTYPSVFYGSLLLSYPIAL